MKKLLVIIIAFGVTSCLTMQKGKALQKFYCSRDLIELKVPSKDVFDFCGKTFREGLE